MKVLLVFNALRDDPQSVRDGVEAWLGAQSGHHDVRYEIVCSPSSATRAELADLIGPDGSLSWENPDRHSYAPDAVVFVDQERTPLKYWDVDACDDSIYKSSVHYVGFGHNHSEPLLSILIPTMPHRGSMYRNLFKEITKIARGIPYRIEVVHEVSDGTVHIGAIRQRALERASGKYVAFIDDDDWVYPLYFSNIIPHLAADADAVGFHIRAVWKNKTYGNWRCSNEYAAWEEGKRPRPDHPIEGGKRPPYHITPMRREIALAAGFPLDNYYTEDAVFSERVVAGGLIKRMPVVEGALYEYRMPMIRGKDSRVRQ